MTIRSTLVLTTIMLILTGCDRFQAPSPEQCKQAVTSLVSHQMQVGLDDAFPTQGGDSVSELASGLLKGVGQELLTKAVVNDQMLGWCEVNMSLHEANCLRAAQSPQAASECGIILDDQGTLAKR